MRISQTRPQLISHLLVETFRHRRNVCLSSPQSSFVNSTTKPVPSSRESLANTPRFGMSFSGCLLQGTSAWGKAEGIFMHPLTKRLPAHFTVIGGGTVMLSDYELWPPCRDRLEDKAHTLERTDLREGKTGSLMVSD